MRCVTLLNMIANDHPAVLGSLGRTSTPGATAAWGLGARRWGLGGASMGVGCGLGAGLRTTAGDARGLRRARLRRRSPHENEQEDEDEQSAAARVPGGPS